MELFKSEPDSYRVEHPKRQSPLEHHKKTNKSENSEIKMEASCIDYKDTGLFSPTVIDYLEDNAALRPFYSYRPDINGFAQILKHKKVIANREILVSVLREQYTHHSPLTTHHSPLT